MIRIFTVFFAVLAGLAVVSAMPAVGELFVKQNVADAPLSPEDQGFAGLLKKIRGQRAPIYVAQGAAKRASMADFEPRNVQELTVMAKMLGAPQEQAFMAMHVEKTERLAALQRQLRVQEIRQQAQNRQELQNFEDVKKKEREQRKLLVEQASFDPVTEDGPMSRPASDFPVSENGNKPPEQLEEQPGKQPERPTLYNKPGEQKPVKVFTDFR